MALVGLKFVWLSLVAIALVLTITNALAFSRCDRFSQASGIVSQGIGGGLARGVVGGVVSRMLRGGS